MTQVPCSVTGCHNEGVRWVHERVRVARYEFGPAPKYIDIPRFVCEAHSRNLEQSEQDAQIRHE